MRLVREILSLNSLQKDEILEHKYRDTLYRFKHLSGDYALLEPLSEDYHAGLKINTILVNEAGLRNYERVGET